MNKIEKETKMSKSKKNFIKAGLANKKKRYLYLLLLILPFVVVFTIAIVSTYKQVKNLSGLISGNTEIKDEYKIEAQNYILRDNATDVQMDYFTQLKQALSSEEKDDSVIAGLICQNYVADFYTWSNKQGQYDIGGMYYLYDGEFINGDHFKENVFLKARDGFYKYINNYINKYGSENILEVESVTVSSCAKTPYDYVINEHVANKQDENGEWYDYREDHTFDAYEVTCTWTYKPSEIFDTSKYCHRMNFIVINKDGRFLITEASENKINERKVEDAKQDQEDTEDNQETA